MSHAPQSVIESIWTVEETAAYLKMSVSWVYKMAALGVLPCFYLGGALRFSSLQIKKYVREQMNRPPL